MRAPQPPRAANSTRSRERPGRNGDVESGAFGRSAAVRASGDLRAAHAVQTACLAHGLATRLSASPRRRRARVQEPPGKQRCGGREHQPERQPAYQRVMSTRFGKDDAGQRADNQPEGKNLHRCGSGCDEHDGLRSDLGLMLGAADLSRRDAPWPSTGRAPERFKRGAGRPSMRTSRSSVMDSAAQHPSRSSAGIHRGDGSTLPFGVSGDGVTMLACSRAASAPSRWTMSARLDEAESGRALNLTDGG